MGGQQVKVRDNGPGIAPEVLDGLFEPFRSVGKSGGTGLGLAYCRRVMKAFGGEIRCDSVRGEFTEFTMRFPPIGEAEREDYREHVLAAAHEVLAGKRLLLVEDDAAQRVTTRHKLRPLGMQVDEAADGQRALDMLARHPYDVVLLDLHMPVVDGYQVAQRVRQGQVPANRYVRIIAHTSEPAHVARVKTQRAGMDGFISKPCAQLPLAQALQRAVQRRSGQRRVAAAGRPPAPAGRRQRLQPPGRGRVPARRRRHGRRGRPRRRRARAARRGRTIRCRAHGPATCRASTASKPRDRSAPAALAGPACPSWRSRRIPTRRPSMRPGGAGMDGFLVKPVEAPVLYDALAAVLAGARAAPRPEAAPVAAPPPDADGPLLNESRLDSYRRLGLLDELLADYLPEIARLVDVLRRRRPGAASCEAAQDALHSLLGMSGEAGALALYQRVRRIYVPVLEQRQWPDGQGWLVDLRLLAGRTEQALRDYAARETPEGIPSAGT